MQSVNKRSVEDSHSCAAARARPHTASCMLLLLLLLVRLLLIAGSRTILWGRVAAALGVTSLSLRVTAASLGVTCDPREVHEIQRP